MRGPAGGLWLAAALLLHVAKGEDRVQFAIGDFSGGIRPNGIVDLAARGGVFQANPDEPPVGKSFTWTATDLRIEQIGLLVHDMVTKKPKPIGFWSGKEPSATPLDAAATDAGEDPAEGNSTAERRAANLKRQSQFGGGNLGDTRNIIALRVTSTADGGTVTIDDLSKAIQGAQPLYFEAIWPNGGRSFSPAFAVLNTADTASLTATSTIPQLFANTPFLPEEQQRTDIATGTATPSDAPLGSAPTPGSSATDSSDNGSSGGGLPTGAIAGIAAACGVLGILLLAFLVWYFLRRRQRKRDALAIHPYASGGVPRSRTDELMAEKEANLASAAAPAVAPGSAPYSDADVAGLEDQQARSVSVAAHRSSLSGGGGVGAAAPLIAPVTAAATVPADGPPTYTPYTDRPASGAGSTAEAAGESGRVVSAQYAHLVEEGMTAEEIRRLEEEERAIDAAIERAVRRPTG